MTTQDTGRTAGENGDPASKAGPTSTSIGDRIRTVGRQWNRNYYQLVTMAADLADSDEWARGGSPNPSHWLAEAVDVEQCTARSWICIGRALRELHATAVAFRDGEISFTKARILAGAASVETEAELLAMARETPAGQLNAAIAAWRTRTSDPEELAAYQHSRRSGTSQVRADGMTRFGFVLPPAMAARLRAALNGVVMRARPQPEPDGSTPSLAQQRADALDTLLTEGAGTIDTEIIIHVRGDGNTFDDGTPVADSVVERLAPTSFLRAMIHDADRVPINVGSKRRHPSLRQQRLVKERDRRCVDCGRTDLLEYDHNPPYAQTGHTIVDELQLRCASCHRQRHRAA